VGQVTKIDIVPLDHTIQRLPVDTEQASSSLFVATRLLEHSRHIASFYFR
jgi:hypothetical protein